MHFKSLFCPCFNEQESQEIRFAVWFGIRTELGSIVHHVLHISCRRLDARSCASGLLLRELLAREDFLRLSAANGSGTPCDEDAAGRSCEGAFETLRT